MPVAAFSAVPDVSFLFPEILIMRLNIMHILTPRQLGSWPGRVAQSLGHLTRKSEVLGSIPGLATYFHFSFR